MSDARLDQKDHVILHALKKDARKTIAEISHVLGIPRATVHERIMKLVRSGVIRRFTIEQDYGKVGIPALVFVYASSDSAAGPGQLAKKLGRIDGVTGVYLTSGEWDILVKIRGKSIEDIGKKAVEQIRKTEGIAKLKTTACFDVIQDEP